jgi:hypothetical protein
MDHLLFMVKRAASVREAWEALKNTFFNALYLENRS